MYFSKGRRPVARRQRSRPGRNIGSISAVHTWNGPRSELGRKFGLPRFGYREVQGADEEGREHGANQSGDPPPWYGARLPHSGDHVDTSSVCFEIPDTGGPAPGGLYQFGLSLRRSPRVDKL